MKSALILLVVLLSLALTAPTQTTNPDTRIVRPERTQPHTVSPQKPEAVPAPAPSADQQEVEALRTDLAHMRTLLNQMRTNLAFVQTTDTPLKHQFDLNNDMWQTLLSDMERRLQSIEHRKP